MQDEARAAAEESPAGPEVYWIRNHSGTPGFQGTWKPTVKVHFLKNFQDRRRPWTLPRLFVHTGDSSTCRRLGGGGVSPKSLSTTLVTLPRWTARSPKGVPSSEKDRKLSRLQAAGQARDPHYKGTEGTRAAVETLQGSGERRTFPSPRRLFGEDTSALLRAECFLRVPDAG